MKLKLSLYALALDKRRCVVCFECDGVVDPVCVISMERAAECGLLVKRGRERMALGLLEQLAHREAKKAIKAAKEGV